MGQDIRVPLSADAGASGALHADFCVVVKGDHKLQPVQDLTDAVAAGCVPILLGVNPKDLPLPKALDYSTFTLTIDDLEFRRYPLETAKTALEAAAPKLPELRKALGRRARRHRPRLRRGAARGRGGAPTAPTPPSSRRGAPSARARPRAWGRASQNSRPGL